MGASASKTAQKASRQFPKRAPGASAPPRPPPASRPPPPSDPAQPPKPSPFAADANLRTDSPSEPPTETMTPAFAARLHQMGIAQPHPTFSPSSTASFPSPDDYRSAPAPSNFPSSRDNQTLSVLEARKMLQERADAEMENLGRRGEGREFLDVGTIRKVLLLRQRGEEEVVIEQRFGLRKGAVGRLGSQGVVQAVEGGARATE